LDCGRDLEEGRKNLCESCEPTQKEIEEMKRWGRQYIKRWRDSTKKLKKTIQNCSDCETPEDEANTLCERHKAQADLAFSGEDTAEIDRELASLEMRQKEDTNRTNGGKE